MSFLLFFNHSFILHRLESRTRVILTPDDGRRRWHLNLHALEPTCQSPAYICETYANMDICFHGKPGSQYVAMLNLSLIKRLTLVLVNTHAHKYTVCESFIVIIAVYLLCKLIQGTSLFPLSLSLSLISLLPLNSNDMCWSWLRTKENKNAPCRL